MIQARNKYYIDIDRSTAPSSYTLAIYVWKGDKTDIPEVAEYSITIQNIELSIETESVEISTIVRDYIEHNKPSLNDGLNVFDSNVWMAYQVFLNDDTTPSQTDTRLFVDGYNTDDSNVLLDGYELTMYDTFLIPLFNGNDYTITSYPNNEIDESINISLSEESSEVAQLYKIQRPLNDTYIRVSDGSKELYIYPEKETRRGNVDITFINSYGVLQTIPFFDEVKESLRISSKEFRTGVSSSGHRYVKFNTNGRGEYKVKSGYHTEGTNKAIESLLLSEYVWYGSDMIPVNISTTTMDYKTRVKDKVISYSITFKESFDKIDRG